VPAMNGMFAERGGDGSVRCVYLAAGANLSGFTLTNGATLSASDDESYPSGYDSNGGGAWCASATATISNCVLVGNWAFGVGGGALSGTLNNCTLSGNSAAYGGAAGLGTLNACILSTNSAYDTGYGYFGSYGGGAYGGTLNNCTLTCNWAEAGGGACNSTLNNCILTGNSAGDGGGACSAGASDESRLSNCTLTGNSADHGGGAHSSTLSNCIVYFNTAPEDPNYADSTLSYCCTTPLPPGIGNISADPQLADAAHVSASSPCRGAGTPAVASGTDIDGEPWANPPSIGCDEYHAGTISGPLSVSVMAAYTNLPVGFELQLTADIQGHAGVSWWEFGDGTVLSNRPYASHAWTAPGDYMVVSRAYNDSLPGGVSATVLIHVVIPPVLYVDSAGTNPVPPYSSWATAATAIQDAVDVASVPGAMVLVTDGIYATGGRALGGRVVNRVAVDKPLNLRSINGPQVTTIQGYQPPGRTYGEDAIRCVYLAGGASLIGFTLTNGATSSDDSNGGGVLCGGTTAIISNCVLTANAAYWNGGGANGGTLYNCTLTGNRGDYGGGAYAATVNNCTLTGNSAFFGGGASDGSLNGCTLTGNSAGTHGGGAWNSTLNNCTLTGNSATQWGGGAADGILNNCRLTGNWAASGGGAFSATLNNCTLTGNRADSGGGGAMGSTLNNCTLTGNSAGGGGGASGAFGDTCTLNNCIVYFNTAANGANYDANCILSYCCTTPKPGCCADNIAGAPVFVDLAGGNLRLQSNSPCINSGNNAYAPGTTDLDGRARLVGGTVDIGAYEFQGPGLGEFTAWLQQYGLPTDGSADRADPDRDGLNNWQEWRCGTNPTNALSVLRLLSAWPTGTNMTVTWSSVAGVSYFLERGTNLAVPASFTPVATDLPGQTGTTSCQDTDAPGAGPLFYRVGVR
jgi:hypothetical protein